MEKKRKMLSTLINQSIRQPSTGSICNAVLSRVETNYSEFMSSYYALWCECFHEHPCCQLSDYINENKAKNWARKQVLNCAAGLANSPRMAF